MSEVLNQIRDSFLNHFKERKQAITSSVDNELLLHYIGDLSQAISDTYVDKFEKLIEEEPIAIPIKKRIFGVFVEAIQNVRIHGHRITPGENLSTIVVYKKKEAYIIFLGNFILNDNLEYLKGKLNKINSLNPEELKKHYLEKMSNGEVSTKGGAGLGIITMALKSKNNLSYKFIDFNKDLSFYELKIRIDY